MVEAEIHIVVVFFFCFLLGKIVIACSHTMQCTLGWIQYVGCNRTACKWKVYFFVIIPDFHVASFLVHGPFDNHEGWQECFHSSCSFFVAKESCKSFSVFYKFQIDNKWSEFRELMRKFKKLFFFCESKTQAI